MHSQILNKTPVGKMPVDKTPVKKAMEDKMWPFFFFWGGGGGGGIEDKMPVLSKHLIYIFYLSLGIIV